MIQNETKKTKELKMDKERVFWNLYTLKNLYSLTEMIQHHQFPQLHTEHDRNYRDLYFNDSYKPNGQPKPETFISRSIKYLNHGLYSTLDRISVFKTQQYELLEIKNQFWRRIYHLKPTSQENFACRKIVRNIVWKERFGPYLSVVILGVIVNQLSGIVKLSVSKRLTTFAVMTVVAELLVTVKKSDEIFYSIPELPSEELQDERRKIIQECLVFDSKINTYGKPSQLENILFKQYTMEESNERNKEKSENYEQQKEQYLEKKKEILEAIGCKVITEADIL